MTSSGAGFARVDGRAEHDCGTLVVQPNEVSATLCASGAGTDRPSAQASQEGFCVVASRALSAQNRKVWPMNVRNAVRNNGRPAGGLGIGEENGPHFTVLADGSHPPSIAMAGGERETGGPEHVVRRLTPVECERLMGFPDGWTDVRFQGKPARDTLRYRALGNSMAVPVMRWLAEGIREFF